MIRTYYPGYVGSWMLKENGGDDAGSFYAYIQQKENRENGGEIDHNDINFNLNNINFIIIII